MPFTVRFPGPLPTVCGVILLTAGAGPVPADTLVIEAVQRDAAVHRPSKGLPMTEVEARFGPPVQVMAAVGDPPITRWVYGGFTVFFEGETVLHSVVHR